MEVAAAAAAAAVSAASTDQACCPRCCALLSCLHLLGMNGACFVVPCRGSAGTKQEPRQHSEEASGQRVLANRRRRRGVFFRRLLRL